MRADRLLALLMLLQSRGRMTAVQLAEQLEVSERTIYRDLDALSAAGVPVYAERGPGGGCALLDSYRTNLTGLTEEEVRALFMLSIPGPLADLGVSQELKAALLKVSAAMPAAYRKNVEGVRQRIYLDAAGWFQPEEPMPHLGTIQEAVWADRRLQVTYRRGDGMQVERRVDPYGLVAKAGIWYLVRALKGRMGVYRVSRVQAAELTEERFERQEGFDLAAYWTEWCVEFEASRPVYPVTLRVAPDLVPTLAHVFGDGIYARVEEARPPDAEGWITLSCTFEHLPMARTQVLGFGTMAEVVEPAELRQSVVEFARGITALYGAVDHG
jgi:predicted DNA-binding transcriptional regulator YafY